MALLLQLLKRIQDIHYSQFENDSAYDYDTENEYWGNELYDPKYKRSL